MELSDYDGRKVRLICKDGGVYEGLAGHNNADYNYHEYGTDMFRMLGSEFALILYDHQRDTFLAARDPIGISPLYYGSLPSGGMAFASEPKNLVGLCETIRPFPPGHYYLNGEFIRYIDLTSVQTYLPDDTEAASSGIRERLIRSVNEYNKLIAAYVAETVGSDVRGDRLISTMIHLPGRSAVPAWEDAAPARMASAAPIPTRYSPRRPRPVSAEIPHFDSSAAPNSDMVVRPDQNAEMLR